MRRFRKRLAGLILAGHRAGGLAARAAETVERLGIGPAYDQLGQVAVMHEGRVKPLDTVAREEVKQVYGRETITLRDPREEVEKLLDPTSFEQGRGERSGRSRSGARSAPSSTGRSGPSSGTTSRSSWSTTSRSAG